MNETSHDPRRPTGGGNDRPATGADLDDDDYDAGEVDEPSGRHRFLSGGRLAAVGAVVVLAGAGLAIALAAGGGDGGGGAGGSGGSGEPTSSEDSALRFAECMRENGVEDFPDPEPGGGHEFGVPGGLPSPEEMAPQERAAFDQASETCGRTTHGGEEEALEPLSAEEQAERQDDALAMAGCMRDRGWDMPDPVVTEEGGIGFEDGALPEPEDPDFDQFAQDQQDCMEEAGLPTPGDGGPGDGDDDDGGGDS